MADFSGELVTVPGVTDGLVDTHPAILVDSRQGGTPVVVHYKLRAHRTSDNTWQYWVDTAIQLTNAPGGAINYDPASLTVEAVF